jgi:hypothetical protein
MNDTKNARNTARTASSSRDACCSRARVADDTATNEAPKSRVNCRVSTSSVDSSGVLSIVVVVVVDDVVVVVDVDASVVGDVVDDVIASVANFVDVVVSLKFYVNIIITPKTLNNLRFVITFNTNIIKCQIKFCNSLNRH